MKNQLFTKLGKNTFGHTTLVVFMVLSFMLQNLAYVQYAFADTDSSPVTEVMTAETTTPVADSVVTEEVVTENQTVVEATVASGASIAATESTLSDESAKSDENEDVSEDKSSDDVATLKHFMSGINTSKPAVTIVATKIVCDAESKLPNWGLGGPDITANTASAYVAAHPGCLLSSDWKFQWGFSSVTDLGGTFVGEADGSKGTGSNTGTGVSDWKTFGITDGSGVATTKIYDLSGTSRIWVREVLKDGYIGFTYDPSHQQNDNNVSAEMYCGGDVLNYDNYDYISQPGLGFTYHCVAFNAQKHVNTAPVITVVGTNPATVVQDATYVDLRATVLDAEDGDITNKLVASGTVDTHTVGTYTISYNATDTQNLAATVKTRTVNVVTKPSCTTSCPVNQPPVITLLGVNPMSVVQNSVFTDPFAIAIDPEDGTTTVTATGTVNTTLLGAYTITYNATDTQGLSATPTTRTVNVVLGGTGGANQKPEITLLGDVIMQLVVGAAFTDPGATAHDPEDGNITAKIMATGTVDVNTLGTYTITYNATDTQNLAADVKTRTVNIVPAPPTGCTSNCGGGSGTSPYPGCIDPNALNYNRLANVSDGSCQYPGGGGGGSVTLTISNEQLIIGSSSVTVTWNTNIAADSRVVYGLTSIASLSAAPSYGYPLTTATNTSMVTSHAVLINGIPSSIATYFRPVSSNGSQTVTGIELTRSPVVTAVSGGSCEYLKEYLRLGNNNNPTEVTKLQLFLKNYEGHSNLAVTGFFDITTDKAVREFQDKYKTDVLDTWNLPSNTGYVYYTTEKKINEIYCQREFPLNDAQKTEIAAFKTLIERVNAANAALPGSGSSITLPVVGVVGNGAQGEIAGASTVKPTQGPTITVTPSEIGELGLATQGKPSVTPEKRGKIALADLLATSPSLASDIVADEDADMSATATDETDENDEVGLLAKNGLLAAVAESVSSRLGGYSSTAVFGFTLMLLALVCIALYFTFRNFGTGEIVADSAEVTAEVVEKK